MRFTTWIFIANLMFGGVAIAGETTVPAITPAEALVKLQDDVAVLVDIREWDELLETGIAEPAIWLAKSDIDARSSAYWDFLEDVSTETEVILYCRSGRRAGLAAPLFQELGYTVFNMGGLSDWIDAGLPVVVVD